MTDDEKFAKILQLTWLRKDGPVEPPFRAMVAFRIRPSSGIPMAWWEAVSKCVLHWGAKK